MLRKIIFCILTRIGWLLLLFCQIACEPYPRAADNRASSPSKLQDQDNAKTLSLRVWQSKETRAKEMQMKWNAKLSAGLKKKQKKRERENFQGARPRWDSQRQSAASTCTNSWTIFLRPSVFQGLRRSIERNISQLIYLSLHSLTWDRRVGSVVVVCCVSTA